MGTVDVKHTSERELTLEWDSSASNDMIADSTLALVTGIDKSPASVKRAFMPAQPTRALILSPVTSHSHQHSHAPEGRHPHADIEEQAAPAARIQRLAMFLEAHFGEIELHMPENIKEHEQGEDNQEPSLLVRLDEADATVNLLSLVSGETIPCQLVVMSPPGRNERQRQPSKARGSCP